MSIFDRIKNFFKNIGNKQKLLESANEKSDDSINVGSYSEEKSDFEKYVVFNPKDLLDPRVCRGDNLVPNILKTLGANEDVLKNPKAVDEIEKQFHGITAQAGIEMPNKFAQPTREQIEAIVEAIKTNGVLSSEQREGKYRNVGRSSEQKLNYGLTIDKETGSVTIGTLSTAGSEINFGNDSYYKEATFSADGKGNVVSTFSYSKARNDKEMLSHDSRRVYNGDGIEMENESHSYKQVDGEEKVTYHRITKRDEQYPFIAQEEVLVDEISLDEYTGKRYIAIEMEKIGGLGNPEYKTDETGKKVPITFENREQISEYYQDSENKNAIANAIAPKPENPLFFPSKLKRSMEAGMAKLMEKAGLSQPEQQAEKEE